MKRRSIATTLLIAVVAVGMTSYAEEKQEAPKTKKQTHCPVMRQNPINKKLHVDVKGYRLYVCCPGCIGKIKADPDKYIKELQDEGITLEKAPVMQTKCPITGRPINKALYVDADGKRLYVCCAGCLAKVKSDPEKYVKQAEDKGIALAPAPKKEASKQETE